MYIKTLFPRHQSFYIEGVEIMHSPIDFYNTIRDSIIKCKERIIITTLYLGKGEKDRKIFSLLRSKDVSINIIVDANRSIKEGFKCNVYKEYGLDKFIRISNKSYDNIPCLPFIIKELLEVYHKKVFVFDDEIILTGANMVDRYFTTHIDRYYKVSNKILADYLDGIIKKDFNNEYQINHYSNLIETDTLLIPFENSGEIEIVSKVLRSPYFKGDKIYLATAYTNFPNEYIDILRELNIKVFIPSHSSNTHNNLSFIDGIINNLFQALIYKVRFLKPLIVFLEGENRYHKKGLWIFDKENNYALTIIGSTNFNMRSIYRDNELSFLIETRDKVLIEKMKEEVADIERWSRTCDIKPPSMVYRLLAFIFRWFL